MQRHSTHLCLAAGKEKRCDTTAGKAKAGRKVREWQIWREKTLNSPTSSDTRCPHVEKNVPSRVSFQWGKRNKVSPPNTCGAPFICVAPAPQTSSVRHCAVTPLSEGFPRDILTARLRGGFNRTYSCTLGISRVLLPSR